jgi:hypothetical protein
MPLETVMRTYDSMEGARVEMSNLGSTIQEFADLV